MLIARTVFLLQDLCTGGTQHQTLALAAGLDRARFAPELWTLSGPTELDALARERGLSVTHLGGTVFPGLDSFAALWRKLGREKPDVFFLCTALPNIWGRVAGRLRKLPLVLGSCRGGGAPVRQHERWLWRLARHIVCNSTALVEVMAGLGVPRAHMSCIANGVDARRFQPGELPFSRREPIILCVARLVEDKDHACLLDAFARVLEYLPEARLCMVGEGPLEAQLRARMAQAPLAGRVDMLPAATDVAACCRSAGVFALSSRQEGTPNVLLEAMACGLPVVATRVGGIPSLLREESGLMAPAGDSGSLAEGLVRVLRDPELAQRMGKAGRERVERDFSFSAMIAAHEELFLRLL
ncbi:MAG: glycosyltransferase [Deltaproteobacteria bacterium]|jgi:glycosyltransferase involved in cell wall biosynthesis|nr:glycosyltransferase [Deltaproteobacteria bacterium]